MPRKATSRSFEIDALKAAAAIAVILIHVLDWYNSDQSVDFLWQWSHYAVGIFVVASGFLLANKLSAIGSFADIRTLTIHRVVRIVAPYIIFLLAYLFLKLLLPSVFDKNHVSMTSGYWLSTIFLLGGFGWNWIPRLFTLLTLVTAGVLALNRTGHRPREYIALFFWLSTILSTVFLLVDIDFSAAMVKVVQVFTWLPLFLFGIMLNRRHTGKQYLSNAVLASFLTFSSCYLWLVLENRSASIFIHENPPTLLFVSYCIFISSILFMLASAVKRPVLSTKRVARLLAFLSNNSYTIFFVHLIVMDAFTKPTNNWATDFLVITSVTVAAVAGINAIRPYFKGVSDSLGARISLFRNMKT